MDISVFLLYPRSPLHLARRGRGDLSDPDEIIHSDTLASALAAALVQLGILKDSDAVRKFLEEVALSSAFPFVEKQNSNGQLKRRFFLPLPKGVVLSRDPTRRKTFKKIRWLEKQLFEKIIYEGRHIWSNHEHTHQQVPCDNKTHLPVSGPYAWMPEEEWIREAVRLISEGEQLRVQVPRIRTANHEPQPYSITYKVWKEAPESGLRAGLFFIARAPQERLQQIEHALDILKDMGLGADRTVGMGTFTWDKLDTVYEVLPSITQTKTTAPHYWMSLGMYVPPEEVWEKWRNQGFSQHIIAHELVLRSGWISIPGFLNVRRNGIYMFSEGSVFKSPETGSGQSCHDNLLIAGKVVDVTPKTPSEIEEKGIRIYRSGKTLFVPVPNTLFEHLLVPQHENTSANAGEPV